MATHDTCRTAVLSFVWFLMLQYFLLQAGCQLFFIRVSWSLHSKTTVFQWQQGSHRSSSEFCICVCAIVTGCWAVLLSDSVADFFLLSAESYNYRNCIWWMCLPCAPLWEAPSTCLKVYLQFCGGAASMWSGAQNLARVFGDILVPVCVLYWK